MQGSKQMCYAAASSNTLRFERSRLVGCATSSSLKTVLNERTSNGVIEGNRSAKFAQLWADPSGEHAVTCW